MDYKNVKPKLNINNAEFLKEILISKDNNDLTPRAIDFFIQLANHAINKLPYENYLDKEDCIQAALYDLMKYWRNFDSNKSKNAFAYFTQMAKNAYAKEFKKIHRNKFLKKYKIFKIQRPVVDIKDFVKIDRTIEHTLEDEDFVKYFRYSHTKKKFSQWFMFEIHENHYTDLEADEQKNAEISNLDPSEIIDFSKDIYYIEIKYEFKDDVQMISLDNFGGNDIYTI